VRGVRYDFTMPRGQVEITGYGVSSKFLASLKPLGIVLAAAIVAFVMRSLRGRNLRLSVAAKSVLSTLCIIAGPIMMVLWVLPVAGCLALAGGIIWKVVMRIRRRRAATAGRAPRSRHRLRGRPDSSGCPRGVSSLTASSARR
jgi:hypothetical protein